MKIPLLMAAIFVSGTLACSTALMADDTTKPADTKQPDATKPVAADTQVVVGKISVSTSGKEVTVITGNGMLFVPEKNKPAFLKYAGKDVKVLCSVVGPDKKLVPEKVLELTQAPVPGKKDKK